MSVPSHRRDFVRGLVAGGAAASLGSRALAHDEAQKEQNASLPEIEARMAILMSRYGTFLDEAAKKAILMDVEAVVRRGEALRNFELSNGDEPFPVFVPFRSPLS